MTAEERDEIVGRVLADCEAARRAGFRIVRGLYGDWESRCALSAGAAPQLASVLIGRAVAARVFGEGLS